MSERVFKFLVAELEKVRVACHHCGGVAELTLDQLRVRLEQGDCRFCGQPLGVKYNGENQLAKLADVLQRLQDLGKHPTGSAAIEFVLPDEGKA